VKRPALIASLFYGEFFTAGTIWRTRQPASGLLARFALPKEENPRRAMVKQFVRAIPSARAGRDFFGGAIRPSHP
jgi:hypothetical protein